MASDSEIFPVGEQQYYITSKSKWEP